MTTDVHPAQPHIEASQSRCHRCQGTDHLVTGDGEPLVCSPCVDLLGMIAARPQRADDRILTALIERHSEVVGLARVPAGPDHGTELRWVWTDGWPSVDRLSP